MEAALDGSITTNEATVATLLLLCGVVGQVGSVPSPHVAAGRDARPDTDQRADPRRDHGGRRCLSWSRGCLPLFELSTITMTTLACIAAVTMLGAAVMALAADDLKRILAWSTVSQLAYMFAGARARRGTPLVFCICCRTGRSRLCCSLAAGSVIHAVGTQRID